MRDILKLHSGTQSGTPVSPPKIAKNRSFFVRGENSNEKKSKKCSFQAQKRDLVIFRKITKIFQIFPTV